MAHIPHNPATTFLPPHSPASLYRKTSFPSLSEPFLSKQYLSLSLRSVLVVTVLALYSLQSFFSYIASTSYNTSIPTQNPPLSTSVPAGSQTAFDTPVPTSSSSKSRARIGRRQHHTYTPQEYQQSQGQYYQTWYGEEPYYSPEPEAQKDDRTEFEKMFYSSSSSSEYEYNSQNYEYRDYNSNHYYQNHNERFFPSGHGHSFDSESQFTDRTPESVPGSECKGYFCADTNTCVDQPIHCPCPNVLDTKCFRSDWYICLRGPQKC